MSVIWRARAASRLAWTLEGALHANLAGTMAYMVIPCLRGGVRARFPNLFWFGGEDFRNVTQRSVSGCCSRDLRPRACFGCGVLGLD